MEQTDLSVDGNERESEGARLRAGALATSSELRGGFIAAGIGLAAIGVLAVSLPFFFTIAVDSIVGLLLIVGGVVHAVHAFHVGRWTGAVLRLLVAALYVIAGVLVLFHPIAGALALTLTLSAFFLAVGVSRLLVARRLHRVPGWGWTLANGIFSVLLGVLLLAGWPGTAMWAIGLVVGIDLLLAGWSLLGLALFARAPIHTR